MYMEMMAERGDSSENTNYSGNQDRVHLNPKIAQRRSSLTLSNTMLDAFHGRWEELLRTKYFLPILYASMFFLYFIIGAAVYGELEGWSVGTSIWFGIVTMATVGNCNLNA